MAPPPNNNNLDELHDRLYRRGDDSAVRRSPLSAEANEVPQAWSSPPAGVTPNPMTRKRLTPRWLTRLSWVSFLFFVVAGLAAALVWYQGGNFVSSSNVVVTIDGPTEIRAGEELILRLKIANHNAAPLDFAELALEYPPGTKSVDNPSQDLLRQTFPLGRLAAGQIVDQLVRVALFGSQDSILPIVASLEYRLADSNAIFDRRTEHNVKITSTPFSVAVAGPAEINANQTVSFAVTITSNTETSITDAVLLVFYPPGFNLKEARPTPITNDRIWSLGTMKAGDTRKLELTGVLTGQSDEEKAFRFMVGRLPPHNQETLEVVYGSAVKSVVIQKPQVALNLIVNGQDKIDYVASNDDLIRVELNWLNNLPTEVVDGEILVTLSGVVVDKTSVAVSKGFYQSNQNRILWNKTSDSALAQLAPAASGRVSFTFALTSLLAGGGNVIKQPAVELTAEFRGKATTDSGVGELVSVDLKRTIKINSVVQLAAKLLQPSGPFTNSGPLPPKVGAETTYTAGWSVINSSNDLLNARVTAVLPPYVRWLGQRTPANESVKFTPYDSGGGEITWELGEIRGGTGINTAAREVFFQVGFTPSLNQVGAMPVIILTPELEGADIFTNQTLTAEYRRPLDTNLISDPLFNSSQARVVE